MPRKLFLTLGSKLEHNDYSGSENQPNMRLRLAADPAPDVVDGRFPGRTGPDRLNQDVHADGANRSVGAGR